ncbi:MAG: pilus assembly protein PilM [Sporolactobacillus sp.]
MFDSLRDLLRPRARAGLAFSDHTIRMVVFRGNAGDLTHLQYWEDELAADIVQGGKIVDEEAFVSTLKEIVHAIGARGRRVSLAIPETQLILRKFELPGLMNDSDLRNYFFVEMGKKVQLPFEQAVFDFQTIMQGAAGTKVILYAAPEPVVRQYQRVLRAAGLEPVSAEFASLGLERWLQHHQPELKQQHRLYVQLESDRVVATIFDRDIPLFVRQVNLARSSGETEENDRMINAADEVERMVDFYRYSLQEGEAGLSNVYLLDCRRRAASFTGILSDALSLPVQPVTFDSERTALPDDLDPVFIPEIGLAMKEVRG